MQHFCKYLCECMLIKSSRDAVYDHQVSKNRTEEHGGASKQIYSVDWSGYPAFCLAIAWENPPPFGEPRPNRRGRLGRHDPPPVSTPTSPPKKNIKARLRKQHTRPSLESEVPTEDQQPSPTSYHIPWTAAAMLQKTTDCRHALGAELSAQVALVKEALCQGRSGTPVQECQVHAELEIMRQAYNMLSRNWH